MSRLPFDPERIHGPADDPPPARRERRYEHAAEAAELSVSEVASLIKSTLDERMPGPLRVVGEVSNLSARHHWYFSLKDENAVVGCVAWASTARKFGFTPKDGDEVVVRGRVSHYPPQGRTQFYVDSMKPVGAGALEAKFRAMCDELRREGYFDESTRQPLPVFPRRIAVVTSASGAAVQDVIATARQRWSAVRVLVVDARVQGDGAAASVAHAIRAIDRRREQLAVDVILVTRGGGSMEDLWAFNERPVADAIFRCTTPVVAAIGHESDTTVAELVADLRAATPTQAAMRIIPSAADLRTQVDHRADQMRRLLVRSTERSVARVADAGRGLPRTIMATIDRRHRRLERLATRLERLRPERAAAAQRQQLAVAADRLRRAARAAVARSSEVDRLEHQLGEAWTRTVERRRGRLTSAGARLASVDPRRVLHRGYSITLNAAGEVVRSKGEVKAGDRLTTKVEDGTIDSVVDGAPARRRRTRKPAADDPPQMDLFGESE